MSLRHLKLKAVYRTEDDNILQDFYVPCLKQSITYDRAVGFFSAKMLSYAAQGLSAFVGHNKGSIRLVIGGELRPDDYLAIKSGYELRANLVEEAQADFSEQLDGIIDGTSDILLFKRLELLAFLIANGQLEIKIALRRRGMYHEKIGIFTDPEGDQIIFQGSANETTSALLPDFNFESINVFRSWQPELKEHFEPYLAGFDKLWSNQTRNTVVIPFPEAAKKRLISIAKSVPKLASPEVEIEIESQWDDLLDSPTISLPQIPQYFEGNPFRLKDHQKRALDEWKAHDLRGVMALATGAGKTITSIFGAVKVFEKTRRLFVGIAVPYQSLADQWVEVLRKFNIFPVQCYESRDKWQTDLQQRVSLYKDGFLQFVCVVVVNRTMQSGAFRNIVREVPGEHFLWIGDECHHHSAERMAEALPEQARFRLGLSATPENFWDSEATARLFGYYGSVVAEYTLRQALDEGVLTPYKYFPILVDLTTDETLEYEGISRKIAQISAFQNGNTQVPEKNESLKNLLIKRARVLGKASNKLIMLERTLGGERPRPLVLFYCGDGSVEDEDSGETVRQIEAVSSALDKMGWRCSRFTAHESRPERRDILDHFRLGMIDAMVAMKCLDEGIDVPACRIAYILASSRNPKQFIQRRGRILRRSPGKEFAEIYDFIIKMPADVVDDNQIEKKLLKAELQRVAEFASLAMNAVDTIKTLRPVLTTYGLEYMLPDFLNIDGAETDQFSEHTNLQKPF